MSKLFKSKFFLGTLVVAAMFVGVVAANATPAAADCSITMTLRVGSVGTEVMCLQSKIGATADGKFGPMTKAAVMGWQKSHGLVGDGIVGPMTRASLMGAPTGNFPAGCTSASGYSTTTGVPCNTGTSAGLPAGCSSTAGYSPLTGTKCDSTTGGNTTGGALQGGAGDAVVSETSTDVESTVNEGDSHVKVNAFKVEAVDSDIAVTSVKVTLEADGASSSSFRLNHYMDSVSVWEGSTKVGSADVADFTKDGNVYSKSIQLSNAIVREGSTHKQTFYVAVDAAPSIDSADFAGTWTMNVDNIRFTDATGAIMTVNAADFTSGDGETTFQFQSLASSGDVKVVVSKDSTSPIAQSVTVSDTGSTKNVPLLAFKVKDTGSDVTFDTLNITLAKTGADTLPDIIGELQLKNGSDTIATIDGADLVVGTNTFNLDNTFTIAADTTDTFKVTATVNDVDNFTSGDSVTASFGSFSPEDENGDVVVDTGAATGSAQTFVNDVPTLAKVGTPTLALLTHTDGTSTGLEDTYKATIRFNVTAPDNAPIYVPKDTFAYGTAGTAGVQYTVSGGAPVISASVQYSGNDDVSGITETNTYRVDAGTTQEFTLVVNLKGNDANNKVTLTGFDYELTDVTPNDSPVVTAPADISTPLVFLAK